MESAGAYEPHGLTASFQLDSETTSRPGALTVRFFGRRTGVNGALHPRDRFVHEESIDPVVPGSGPRSISAKILGINPGLWNVTAHLVSPMPTVSNMRPRMRARETEIALEPAGWSWLRWALVPRAPGQLKARLAALTSFDRMPAVIPGSWLVLVTLGVVIGFILQGVLLPHAQVSSGRVFPISLLAVAAALLGAKLWYAALKLRSWRTAFTHEGWCIQGALVGATAVGVGMLALQHLPIGVVVDATTPGLFLGIAIGRLGCFFTGCCAGRPSSARFAVWCSDRRVGARRVPTQLLESLAGAAIGLASLVIFLRVPLAAPGALFLASMAAYTLCRQPLLRLRLEPRRTAVGVPMTAALAGLVLAASVAWLLVSTV